MTDDRDGDRNHELDYTAPAFGGAEGRDRVPALDATIAATAAATATDAGPEGTAGALDSRYRVERVIGRGGMGEVVAARDEQIGRSIAIKRMLGAAPSPEATARFLREARIQGRLEHPAIVPVHELSHDDQGRPYFAMKRLAGTTLADVIAKPEAMRGFSRQRLLRSFADVCLAIEFAHSRGVIHRDLKPANIMLGEFGEVHVLDWGIARVRDDARDHFADVDTFDDDAANTGATAAGAILGTPGYMAPEQVEGAADLDGRADVYALGCILFELLAGESLHPRGRAGLAAALSGSSDARPSARRPDANIAPELDAVCVAATAADRGKRLASARELGDLVQRYLDGDRDLAQRRELAREEMSSARAAIAHGDTEADRRTAIRAAARALALDPTAPEPAALVGQLMITPPSHVPAEVELELAEVETVQLRSSARIGMYATMANFAFLPAFYLIGVHDLRYLSVLATAVIASMAGAFFVARRPHRKRIRIAVYSYMIYIAVFSWLMTPFFIAPAIACVTVNIFTTQPGSGPAWRLYLAMASAVLVPWLLEAVGVLRQSTTFSGANVVLTTVATKLEPTAAHGALVTYVLSIIALSVWTSRTLAHARRSDQRELLLQAWHLRQLVAVRDGG